MDFLVKWAKMKIDVYSTKTIKATDIKGLDPITLFIENIEDSKGRLTILCHGKAWTVYWGGMSGKTVEDFFLSCNNSYIISILLEDKGTMEIDYIETKNEIKRSLFSRYRKSVSPLDTKDEYREDYDFIQDYHIETLNDVDMMISSLNHDDIYEVIYENLPKRHTDEYLYLDKIVTATKEILKHNSLYPKPSVLDGDIFKLLNIPILEQKEFYQFFYKYEYSKKYIHFFEGNKYIFRECYSDYECIEKFLSLSKEYYFATTEEKAIFLKNYFYALSIYC